MPKVTSFKSTQTLQYEMVMAHDIRFDADDSAPVYIGLNQMTDADENAISWIIYKFTYSGANVTRIQKAHGSWTDRATLFI